MKVLFAGPSIYNTSPDLSGIELRAPAAQGNLAKAVLDGAFAIGLVDGHFEASAAVWHKEILFALSKGVRVLGAASMGALRAAECHSFGMEPIGVVAARYVSGTLDDDAAVAQVHAPAELRFAPLSETSVDADATIENLQSLNLISNEEAAALRRSSSGLFFKVRTADSIVKSAALKPNRTASVLKNYKAHHVSIKEQDALILIKELKLIASPSNVAKVPNWQFSQPAIWKRSLASIGR